MRPTHILLALVVVSLLASIAAAQDADSVNYLPLSEGNVWTYATPGFQPNLPVTARSVVVSDTLYQIVPFPALPADTLRIGDEGSVYARVFGQDLLLLDTRAEEGATYSFPLERWPDLFYEVTVYHAPVVEVAAGTFENCISFEFDSPMVADEELYITLAPNIGIVVAATAWEHQELWRAEIDGVLIPPLDATISDTLDWHGYFPLEVGNVWEYRYDSLYEPGYVRYEIVADSILGEKAGFAVVHSSFDDALREKFRAWRLWYYDDSLRSAATDLTHSGCDLSAPFPIPPHHEVPVSCGAGAEYLLSGGYTGWPLEIGSDFVRSASWKWFNNVGGGFALIHGIGVPGWAVEGTSDSAHLIYARLGGVEYGGSVVATSIELPGSPPRDQFAAYIFPNPFSDRFTIEVNDSPLRPMRYEVVDLLGRRVLSGRVEAPRTDVDAGTLAFGLYFVRIANASRVLATRTIVKAAAR